MKRIPSFMIFLDAENKMQAAIGVTRLPVDAMVMYCEEVKGGHAYMNGFNRSHANGALALTIETTRRDICELDPRWYTREWQERMDAGNADFKAQDYDNAAYEFETAAAAAQQGKKHLLYVRATRAVASCYNAEGDFANAFLYLSDAMEVADMHCEAEVKLCTDIRDEMQQAEAKAVAPHIFHMLDEVQELQLPGTNGDDWNLAEDRCREVIQAAIKAFGGQHWLVAVGMRELADFEDEPEARRLLTVAAAIASEWGPPDDRLRKSIARELKYLENCED